MSASVAVCFGQNLSSQSSALAALQSKALLPSRLSPTDLHEAIESDLKIGNSLSEAFVTKYMRSVNLPADLRADLLSKIQDKMADVLYSDPLLFLNYSRVAVLLTGKSVPHF